MVLACIDLRPHVFAYSAHACSIVLQIMWQREAGNRPKTVPALEPHRPSGRPDWSATWGRKNANQAVVGPLTSAPSLGTDYGTKWWPLRNGTPLCHLRSQPGGSRARMPAGEGDRQDAGSPRLHRRALPVAMRDHPRPPAVPGRLGPLCQGLTCRHLWGCVLEAVGDRGQSGRRTPISFRHMHVRRKSLAIDTLTSPDCFLLVLAVSRRFGRFVTQLWGSSGRGAFRPASTRTLREQGSTRECTAHG